MCGICGFSWSDDNLIGEMVSSLKHRGPDDQGSYVDDSLSLGHTRLSIIDLTEAGHQPFIYESSGRKVVVVFNGEIYNYRELREELKSEGYVFRSDCDTEVIAASYLRWGQECLAKLFGMWAFAIYEPQQKLLFLARDRFGQKPLYYYLSDKKDKFIFASEIKAILKHDIARDYNENEIRKYLYGYAPERLSETFFEKIKRLPAGYYASFSLKTNYFRKGKWYSLPEECAEISQEEFVDALRTSVKRRLVSDVPVSVSLSGGLDSTSIALLLSELSSQRYNAFTLKPNGSAPDETNAVRDFVALHPQFKLTTVESSGQGFADNLVNLVGQLDEPIFTDSMFVRGLIAKALSERGLKVILNGEGADELLGGYWDVEGVLLRDAYRSGNQEVFAQLCKRLDLNVETAHGLLNEEQGLEIDEKQKLKEQFGISLDLFVQEDWTRDINLAQYRRHQLSRNILTRLLNANDKAAMAYGVEARTPFLDHELVEKSLGFSADHLLGFGGRKQPLRKMLKSKAPDSIVNQVKKVGFSSPYLGSLLSSQMTELARSINSNSKIASFIDVDRFQKTFEHYQTSFNQFGNQLLHLISLEIWMREYLK